MENVDLVASYIPIQSRDARGTVEAVFEIYSDTTKIAENDNWSVSLASTAASVGAFALTAGSKDAAITVSLPKGGYTVQVSGADGGVGDALVEIYELP